MTEKKKELPKLVTLADELLKQLTMFVSSMPIMSAQKAVKTANENSWPDKDNEKNVVISLKELDNLASYLRILPLYQSGELYTMIQMGVKEHAPSKVEEKGQPDTTKAVDVDKKTVK